MQKNKDKLYQLPYIGSMPNKQRSRFFWGGGEEVGEQQKCRQQQYREVKTTPMVTALKEFILSSFKGVWALESKPQKLLLIKLELG